MNTKARIKSIREVANLDSSITGFPSFQLDDLIIAEDLDFDLPKNIRLGHLAEKVVSELIHSSSNCEILYENVQIIEQQQTIGELDYIIKNKQTHQCFHLELAYKFYLLDPSLSSHLIENWIGPNRNDSLSDKLKKLESKQFPLLYHKKTTQQLSDLNLQTMEQRLCLLASLYVPYNFKGMLPIAIQIAVKGYYINLAKFLSIHQEDNQYYLPSKKEWGIDPSTNEIWHELIPIEKTLKINIEEKQAPLCWQKKGDEYAQFFIVWW